MARRSARRSCVGQDPVPIERRRVSLWHVLPDIDLEHQAGSGAFGETHPRRSRWPQPNVSAEQRCAIALSRPMPLPRRRPFNPAATIRRRHCKGRIQTQMSADSRRTRRWHPACGSVCCLMSASRAWRPNAWGTVWQRHRTICIANLKILADCEDFPAAVAIPANGAGGMRLAGVDFTAERAEHAEFFTCAAREAHGILTQRALRAQR